VLSATLPLAAPAFAAEVPRLEGAVTDEAGVLGDRTAEVEAALGQIRDRRGVQLFVLFVDTTDGVPSTDFADETARVNSLGGDDALLLVAIEDRTDAIWVSDALPITDSELDSIVVDVLEPRLRVGDFAGAAIATAEALGVAALPATPEPIRTVPPDPTAPPVLPGGGSSSGIDVGSLVGVTLLGVVIAIIAIWLVVRLAAMRETGERSRRLASLAQRANAALIAADDRIRAAEQEAGFVEAEFGESEAAPFRAAVADARVELRAGFAIRQRLDDSDPEDPPTREAMLNQLVESAARANAVLDAQAERIEKLRSLERDAPTILAALPTQIEAVERRLPGADKALAELETYADAAWDAVRGNAAEARKGLAGARAAVERGTREVASRRSAAVREIVVAQQGVAGAAALLDAIDKLATTLESTAAGLAGEIEAAGRDLAEARSAVEVAEDVDRAAYADPLRAAEADLGAARRAADARSLDPIAAARLVATARRSSAELLADVRRDVEEARRFAAALESSIAAAHAEIDRAADFIATRRSGVRRQARTRLNEAERLLERALAARESDPKAALQQAQRADRLAGEAYTLATMDFARWDSGRGGGANAGADVAGAILGGIIGGILSGGGRGGWGGSPWGNPGSGGGSSGPFGGGWGGGGHSAGGGFGGFGGGGSGGGGGHSRGGRW
jgi:uncharacterized membrane protein YgcG